MNTRSVIIISIGPVQGFIAASRRSRDLRNASWLLSDLSRTAARAVRDFGEVVFPASLDDDAPVANKIVAVVGDAPAAGRAAGEAVGARILQLSDDAFRNLRELIESDKAREQIRDLPEVVWAASPIVSGYAEARRTAERLLAARKSLRDFSQVTWGSDAPKSNLDGQRESVIDEGIYPKRGDGETKRLQFAGHAARLGIKRKGSERLCGPGLLKRRLESGGAFPSTSGVAASAIDRRLRRDHADARDRYLQALDGCSPEYTRDPFDAIVFVREQLDEVVPDENLERARNALDDLYGSTDVDRPLPYYAILAADGDRMGELINALDGEDDHRRLSTALAGFARSARGIVERSHGSIVYAGGDDVLAFLPLDKALRCAADLATAFSETLGDFRYAAGGGRPTLSAGLGVSHYFVPLQDALELARKAEDAAKTSHGRDAIHVIVSKRSGSETGFGGRWHEALAVLDEFAGMHLADEVPDGLAYQLRDLAHRLERGVERAQAESLRQPLRIEGLRLIGRKRGQRGARDLDDGVRASLAEVLDRKGVAVLSDALVVAKTFADARRVAGEQRSQKEVQA